MGFEVFSNKIEAMPTVRLTHNRRWLCALVKTSLIILFAGLVLTAFYPAFAISASLSLTTKPLRQADWPTVGTGAGSMRFEQLGIQEGLSDNAVLAVFQDSLGFFRK